MKIQFRQFDVLKSTNTTATAAAALGAPEGTVIVAARQEDGHGRMQRIWCSPLGGLWFTIILRPHIDPQYAAQITLLAGVAVTLALRKLYETDSIKIKWPNDLLMQDKKVCGILSELQLDVNGDIDYIVVGIGVNVALKTEDFSPQIRSSAASLNESLKKSFTTQEVLREIMVEFVELYQEWLKQGALAVIEKWRKLNCTIGRNVLVKDNDKIIFQGIAADIDERGALQVCDAKGKSKSFNFGEISIR